jgi:UDP-N-acetylmuramoyl-tripeptide--D-alanyl-D-alanine ligase
MTFSTEEVLKATGGKLLQGEEGIAFREISTDSRTVGEGDLFIALKGQRFDGHHFVMEVLGKKAGGVVIEEEKVGDMRWNGYRFRTVIAVKDTLRALGDLARERRRKFGIPVVALTGSNGKTTSKEMIFSCLETTFPVLKTEGNFNNLIGLPLTLLRLTEKERVVVLEMGMNVPGEIRRLTEIAEPDVGLITNIERVHLEGLGNIERVKEEKGELFRKMKKDGVILVNQDDPRVVDLAMSTLAGRLRLVSFSLQRRWQKRSAHGQRGNLFYSEPGMGRRPRLPFCWGGISSRIPWLPLPPQLLASR